jgi:hypothetical protein
MHRMLATVLSITKHLPIGAGVLVSALLASPTFAHDNARSVKVMIINMFGGNAPSEASAFTGNLGLTQSIPSSPGDNRLGGVGALSHRLRHFMGDRRARDSRNPCRSDHAGMALWIPRNLSHRYDRAALELIAQYAHPLS